MGPLLELETQDFGKRIFFKKILTEIKGDKVNFSNWDPGLKFYSHTLGIEFKSDKGLIFIA